MLGAQPKQWQPWTSSRHCTGYSRYVCAFVGAKIGAHMPETFLCVDQVCMIISCQLACICILLIASVLCRCWQSCTKPATAWVAYCLRGSWCSHRLCCWSFVEVLKYIVNASIGCKGAGFYFCLSDGFSVQISTFKTCRGVQKSFLSGYVTRKPSWAQVKHACGLQVTAQFLLLVCTA